MTSDQPAASASPSGRSASRRGRRRRQGKPAGAIYGQVVATSTLAVLDHDASLGPVAVLLSVLAAMLVLWIAHVYSEVVAERVHLARELSWEEVATAMAEDWPLVQAAVPAVLAMALAALGVWSRDTGVVVGLALGVLSLFGWGVVIGRRSRATWPRTLAVAALSSVLGVVIIALELAIH